MVTQKAQPNLKSCPLLIVHSFVGIYGPGFPVDGEHSLRLLVHSFTMQRKVNWIFALNIYLEDISNCVTLGF